MYVYAYIAAIKSAMYVLVHKITYIYSIQYTCIYIVYTHYTYYTDYYIIPANTGLDAEVPDKE